MKLPRWLVISMRTLSVLAVLAAAGWWWVTWPERTAREFVALIDADEWDEARSMFRPDPAPEEIGLYEIIGGCDLSPINSIVQPRSRELLDVLAGRQCFRTWAGDEIEVTRGIVSVAHLPWGFDDFRRNYEARAQQNWQRLSAEIEMFQTRSQDKK